MEWRDSGGVRWLEAGLPGATAAFSTRVGGVSEAPFDGLNLGLLTEDDPDAVAENRRLLAAAVGFTPERIAIGHQVHGARLIENQPPLRCSLALHNGAKEQQGGAVPEADGQIISRPGSAALVFVADCVPVALAGPDHVAMLHCGWRGLAAGIVARGVEAIGATDAAIGPSIGPCCYEVGDEVLEQFDGLGEGLSDGRMLNLPGVARRFLHTSGVERIEVSGLCTSCEAVLFFSHRRDEGRTGRQAGLVWRHGEDG
jgi:YfiH family protein